MQREKRRKLKHFIRFDPKCNLIRKKLFYNYNSERIKPISTMSHILFLTFNNLHCMRQIVSSLSFGWKISFVFPDKMGKKPSYYMQVFFSINRCEDMIDSALVVSWRIELNVKGQHKCCSKQNFLSKAIFLQPTKRLCQTKWNSF